MRCFIEKGADALTSGSSVYRKSATPAKTGRAASAISCFPELFLACVKWIGKLIRLLNPDKSFRDVTSAASSSSFVLFPVVNQGLR
jgi:hypothetical protein